MCKSVLQFLQLLVLHWMKPFIYLYKFVPYGHYYRAMKRSPVVTALYVNVSVCHLQKYPRLGPRAAPSFWESGILDVVGLVCQYEFK